MKNLELLSAAEIGREVNAGHISPTEVVRYFEERIEEHNQDLNAFVYTKFEYAEEAAKELEARLAAGEDVGPFAGVPFALKDFLPSKKGWTHSHGGVKCLIKQDPIDSPTAFAERPTTSSTARPATPLTPGTTPAGRRAAVPRLWPADSSPSPRVAMPADPSASPPPGATSSGSRRRAGGSIRIPAAWCNLFGFKASVGTIPSVCRPDAWSATHPYCFNGGLTKTVEDLAILLNYMGRYDPRDPLSLNHPPRDFTKLMERPMEGWRIAFTPNFGIFPVEPEVLELVERAANRFKEAGAIVEPVDFHLPRTADEYADIWCRSISVDSTIEIELDKQNGFDLIGDHREELPEEFIYYKERVAKGGVLDYYKFNCARTELLDAHEDVFEKYDLILSPTTCCMPPLNANDGNTLGPELVNGTPVNRLIGYAETFLVNFTGHPAASVPAGFLSNGLPVGMQIIGKKFKDEDVFTAARTFEKLQPWRQYYDTIVS